LQWQTRNRSAVHEKMVGLYNFLLLALEQSGDRTGALLSKNINRAIKSVYSFFPLIALDLCSERMVYCAATGQYIKST
jgi:hypothetical protein